MPGPSFGSNVFRFPNDRKVMAAIWLLAVRPMGKYRHGLFGKLVQTNEQLKKAAQGAKKLRGEQQHFIL